MRDAELVQRMPDLRIGAGRPGCTSRPSQRAGSWAISADSTSTDGRPAYGVERRQDPEVDRRAVHLGLDDVGERGEVGAAER